MPTPAQLPPQDLDAEEYVLGAMMLTPAAVEAAAEVVVAGDFYRSSHALIFQACVDLHNAGVEVDAITVHDRLAAQGQIEEAGGRTRIHELAALVPASRNIRHHALIVREMATLRDLTRVGYEIQQFGWERVIGGEPAEASALAAEAERRLFELSKARQHGDFVTASSAAADAYRRLEQLAADGRQIVGLATGFDTLDRMTSGLHPGSLVLIAGRPSMGKTALGLGIAANVTIRHDPPVPVALFTLEMNRGEVMQRLFSSESLVDSAKIITPRRLEGDRESWGRVMQAANRVAEAPLFIEDSRNISVADIRSKARRLKLQQPDLGLVIVDYLGLLRSTGERFERRDLEVAQTSRTLKMLAGELEVPVVALSQLSRETEKRHDHRPELADLRESGALEQDADVVMFVYREEYYFPEDDTHRGIAEIIFAKHRNGPTGTRKLAFVDRYARFSDLPHDQQ